MVTLQSSVRKTTIPDMPGPVTDARAHELRERYHRLFPHPELPVPVEAIAEDLLGLYVDEDEIDCSGLLLPAERRIVVKADEPARATSRCSPRSSARPASTRRRLLSTSRSPP